MSDSVLVLGGGIAGIQASLDLAEAGARVVLVEKEATIGGIMAVLDKNFPTLDCSICIEAPKMSEVAQHPNIEILSLSHVEKVEGKPGDFRVSIRRNARYVTDACTRCGECASACPIVLPNEYDSGMAARKAIYTPIPQSVPGTYVIDIEHCLNDPPNYLPCNHCLQICPPKAIDFGMPKASNRVVDVGAIIVAIGYDTFDPRLMVEYGYGTHPDILTLPTVGETVPGFAVDGWTGMWAPAGTPRDVVVRLNQSLGRILKLPEVQELLRTFGAEPAHSTPEDFTRLISRDLAMWTKVVKTGDIRIN